MTDKHQLSKLEMIKKQNNYIFDNSILFNKKDMLMNNLEKTNNNSKELEYDIFSSNNINNISNKDVDIENNLIKCNNTRELRQEKEKYKQVDHFIYDNNNNISELELPISTRL